MGVNPRVDGPNSVTVTSELPDTARVAPSLFMDPAEPGLAAAADLAERVLAAATVASVTLVRDGRPHTPSASGELGRQLDEVQYAAGRGPCLLAASGGGTANVRIADERRRWPEFSAAASEAGVRSSLSLPLDVNGRALGALNIYSASDRLFTSEEQALAEALARQASSVAAMAAVLADAQRMTEQLREALETRDLIGQAKGILMERESCTPEAAFDILRRASQRTNRKLRDVAADLVSTRARRDGRR